MRRTIHLPLLAKRTNKQTAALAWIISACLLVLSQLTVVQHAYAQAALCADAIPISDVAVPFPAATTGEAESGNDYGCMFTQYAPTWFYMQLAGTGTVNLTINNSNSLDVDWAVWGPFNNFAAAASNCGSLTAPSVACDYTVASTGSINLSGTAGQVFLLLVTAYSPADTNVTITQTGGTTSLAHLSAFSVNNVTQAEGNGGGTTNFTFTVIRSGDTTSSSTVSAQTANGTAIAGTDYNSAGPTTLTFAADSTQPQTQSFTVQVRKNSLYEGDKTFYVDLSSATGNGVINQSQGTGTITNDDPAPLVTLSIDQLTIAENGGVATITATQNAVSALNTTVILTGRSSFLPAAQAERYQSRR